MRAPLLAPEIAAARFNFRHNDGSTTPLSGTAVSEMVVALYDQTSVRTAWKRTRTCAQCGRPIVKMADAGAVSIDGEIVLAHKKLGGCLARLLHAKHAAFQRKVS